MKYRGGAGHFFPGAKRCFNPPAMARRCRQGALEQSAPSAGPEIRQGSPGPPPGFSGHSNLSRVCTSILATQRLLLTFGTYNF